MDEAEFGVNDISEEDYNRMKAETIRKEKHMAKKKKKKGKKKNKKNKKKKKRQLNDGYHRFNFTGLLYNLCYL